ncbi:uncharacterized protein LOC123952130 [Meles meles]|uniref:uncharacterized protein LOC123952130 n=1 Tax=Meles meles TaxID=9662 RepID=UPI001E69D66F|nr:uncharacterized protein LOC123952130 [Meles meles]
MAPGTGPPLRPEFRPTIAKARRQKKPWIGRMVAHFGLECSALWPEPGTGSSARVSQRSLWEANPSPADLADPENRNCWHCSPCLGVGSGGGRRRAAGGLLATVGCGRESFALALPQGHGRDENETGRPPGLLSSPSGKPRVSLRSWAVSRDVIWCRQTNPRGTRFGGFAGPYFSAASRLRAASGLKRFSLFLCGSPELSSCRCHVGAFSSNLRIQLLWKAPGSPGDPAVCGLRAEAAFPASCDGASAESGHAASVYPRQPQNWRSSQAPRGHAEILISWSSAPRVGSRSSAGAGLRDRQKTAGMAVCDSQV